MEHTRRLAKTRRASRAERTGNRPPNDHHARLRLTANPVWQDLHADRAVGGVWGTLEGDPPYATLPSLSCRAPAKSLRVDALQLIPDVYTVALTQAVAGEIAKPVPAPIADAGKLLDELKASAPERVRVRVPQVKPAAASLDGHAAAVAVFFGAEVTLRLDAATLSNRSLYLARE